jgi:hypothetical protein
MFSSMAMAVAVVSPTSRPRAAVDPPSSRVTNSGTATVRMAPAAPQNPRASASWGQRE